MINCKIVNYIGEDIKLRALTNADVYELYKLKSDPNVYIYTDSICDSDMDTTAKYIQDINFKVSKNQMIYWAITINDKLIGTICIWNIKQKEKNGELAYFLMPKFQKHGYMSQALKLVIFHAFKIMKLKKLFVYTSINNITSNKLVNKFNFSYTKNVIEDGYNTNKSINYNVYVLENNNS